MDWICVPSLCVFTSVLAGKFTGQKLSVPTNCYILILYKTTVYSYFYHVKTSLPKNSEYFYMLSLLYVLFFVAWFETIYINSWLSFDCLSSFVTCLQLTIQAMLLIRRMSQALLTRTDTQISSLCKNPLSLFPFIKEATDVKPSPWAALSYSWCKNCKHSPPPTSKYTHYFITTLHTL